MVPVAGLHAAVWSTAVGSVNAASPKLQETKYQQGAMRRLRAYAGFVLLLMLKNSFATLHTKNLGILVVLYVFIYVLGHAGFLPSAVSREFERVSNTPMSCAVAL